MNSSVSNKTMIGCAIASALALSPSPGIATVLPVLYMEIKDVGSTIITSLGTLYSATRDFTSGGFSLGEDPISPVFYTGASLFTGDAGPLLFDGNPNPVGSFTSGIPFSGDAIIPFTFGSDIVADVIDIKPPLINPGLDLDFTSFVFGATFGTESFNMSPDLGFPTVNWIVDNGFGTYLTSFQWSHMITTAEDSTGNFTGFEANWILEGCISTVSEFAVPCNVNAASVPIPAAAWLFGTGLLGLIGISRRKKTA